MFDFLSFDLGKSSYLIWQLSINIPSTPGFMPSMKFKLQSLAALSLIVPALLKGSSAFADSVKASETQPVTIRFAAKVDGQPFACGSNYSLGKPATEETLSDFRFYVTDIALVDESGKSVPVTLEQDNKWQYQNIALLDFENKTGACTNGTVEMRDQIIGTVPKGNYTGVKFTLGVPAALNHEDATLAPSPLNLTGLWWSWLFGYKFARIDLESPTIAQSNHKQHNSHNQGGTEHNKEQKSGGFPIHLGSTGCEKQPNGDQPTTCSNYNRATVVLTNFNPEANIVVADLARLVAASNLRENQAKTAPGCMSEPNDQDCIGIMKNLGLPFMNQPATTQTFFSVE